MVLGHPESGIPQLRSPRSDVRTPGEDTREVFFCSSVAVALVLLRAAVFLRYEILDSDQAIVGLMAKHASEFRAFPLFFYGQNYMLGVQAWIAVPFFWVGGPTVAMLRLPLVLINIAVAVGLIVALARYGVRPRFSLVAVLPLIATPPAVSAELVSTLGASVEPFAYVLLLWLFRRRPFTFGALLCFGALHREFTIFALPAIVAVHWRSKIDWLAALKAVAAFAAVWIAVDILKLRMNALGVLASQESTPGGGSLVQEAVFLGQIVSFKTAPYAARIRDLLTRGLPDLLGVGDHPVSRYGLPGAFVEGSRLAAVALVGATALCGARLFSLVRGSRRRDVAGLRFCAYLALVGFQAILAYGLNVGIDVAAPPVLRYVLFALFLPVALFGAYFQMETGARWKRAAAALILLWAFPNIQDNARLLRDLLAAPPPNEHRILADYLRDHRIKYGWATYWDCYVVDFLARERVILASTDIIRVPGYQDQVDRNRLNAATVRRAPCDEGARVADWCVSDPFNR
jgi:hypothetical protein